MPFIKINIEIPVQPGDADEKTKVELHKTSKGMLNVPERKRSSFVKVKGPRVPGLKAMPKPKPKPGKSIMTREKEIPFDYKGDQEFKKTTKKMVEENE